MSEDLAARMFTAFLGLSPALILATIVIILIKRREK